MAASVATGSRLGGGILMNHHSEQALSAELERQGLIYGVSSILLV